MIDIREHGGIYADGGGGGGTTAGANIPGNTTGNIYGFKEDEKMSPYLKNSFNIVAGENIKKGDMIICKNASSNKFNVMTEFVGNSFSAHKDYTFCNKKLYYHDYKNEKYVPIEVPGIPSVNTFRYFEEYKIMIINDNYYFKVNGTTMSSVVGEPTNYNSKGRINNEGQILVKKGEDSYGFIKLPVGSTTNIVKGEKWPSWVNSRFTDISINYWHLMDSFVFKGKYVYVYPSHVNTTSVGTGWPIYALVFVHFTDSGMPEIVHIPDIFFQAGSGGGSDFTDKLLGLSKTYDNAQDIMSPSSKDTDFKIRGSGIFNYNGEFAVLAGTNLLSPDPSYVTLHTGDGKFKTVDDKRLSFPIGLRDTRGTFTDRLEGIKTFMFPPLFSEGGKVTAVVVGVKVKTGSNYVLGDVVDKDMVSESGISHKSSTTFGYSDFIRGIAMENASQGSLVRIQRIW